MADKNKGQAPGDDVALAFDMDFDDDKAGNAFGAPEHDDQPPPRRAAAAAPPPPPPSAFGDDDFEEMPEPGSAFGAQPAAPRDDFGDVGHGAAHGASDFGHDAGGFGTDDPVEDFDAQPADGNEHDQTFADAEGGMEFEGQNHEEAVEEDEDAVLREGGEDDEDADAHAVEPEVAHRSLLQRMMVPAIGLLGVAGVGYAGWTYAVQPMFFPDAPVQVAQRPGIVTTPQVGMPKNGQVPPPPYQSGQKQAGTPGLAPLPSAPAAQRPVQAPQVQAPQVQAPQVQAPPVQVQPVQAPLGSQIASADPAAPVGPSAVPPPTPVGNPLAAMPAPPSAPPGQVPTGMNRPGDDVMAKMFAAIDSVSTDVKAMSRRLDGVEKSGNDMRADLGRRIDDIEKGKGVQVASAVPGQLPPVTVRAPSAPSLTKTDVRPAVKPAAEPAAPKATRASVRPADDDEERAERPARKQRHASRSARRDDADGDPEDKAYAGDGPADEPPAKPRVIGSYRLQGVSMVGGRQVALVRTKRGLEEIAVGQTVTGGGEVRSIRENGGKWVVVTTRGVIVE